MDYPLMMSSPERLSDLNPNLQSLIKRQLPFGESVGKRLPFQIFHHQKINAILRSHVMQGADVRMLKGRDSFGFAIEALLQIRIIRKMGRQYLDGNRAVESGIASPINLSHTACA